MWPSIAVHRTVSGVPATELSLLQVLFKSGSSVFSAGFLRGKDALAGKVSDKKGSPAILPGYRKLSANAQRFSKGVFPFPLKESIIRGFLGRRFVAFSLIISFPCFRSVFGFFGGSGGVFSEILRVAFC